MWEEGSLNKNTVTTGGDIPAFGFTCIICEEVQAMPTHFSPIVQICYNCRSDLKELVLGIRQERQAKQDYIGFENGE